MNFLSQLTGVEFYTKREDLINSGGGGNKARMLRYILKKAKDANSTHILTAGGPHSNFNRALAMMATQEGFKVRIVLFDKNIHLQKPSLNKRICDWLGTEYIPCDPERVEKTIQSELLKLKEEGHSPYFVWGGGQCLEGSLAYFDAVREIQVQNNFQPDLLVTTLATGTTFTGLFLGAKSNFPTCKTLGISVARENKDSFPVVARSIQILSSHLGLPEREYDLSASICDEYRMGGYGIVNQSCREFIQLASMRSGIILDEIYVGKALYGLVEYLGKNPGYQGKKVLFLNSGGLFNF
jgi:1-aminocyclopropane-1-carboxylate deaminase/D-cysteine desulfhydrase-like pyridoxal-dependent ACC family enzyme